MWLHRRAAAALSFNELKSEKAFREIHIPKHICSASSRMETKVNEVQYFRWPFLLSSHLQFQISYARSRKEVAAEPDSVSFRARSRRHFVCPSNERAQVHLSFQFLSFHNATLWIYIVYSYLPHCIHSRPPPSCSKNLLRNGFENRVELATGSRIEKHQGEGYLGDAFSNIFALMEK